MNLSERIQAAEAELLSLKDALVEATKSLEAAPDEETLLIQVEELAAKTEKQDAAVVALKKAEKALAERAVAQAPTVIPQVKKDGKGDGSLLWKMAAAQVVAFSKRVDVQDVVAEKYAGDQQLDAVIKSTVNPAMTTTAGWAAELMRTDIQGFLNTLRTTSVAAELASRSQVLSFGGYDSITVPMRNALGAGLTEPAWVN
jgi:hypothetical protein